MNEKIFLDSASLQLILGKLNPLPINCNKHMPSLLLVDDEPRLLNSLSELLKGNNYNLATATKGCEAIEQLTNKQFDIVLLDLMMPEMNGYAVMDFIKENNIDVNVIIISGCDDIDVAIEVLKYKISGYLRKPYSYEALINLTEEIIKQRQAEIKKRYELWLLESSEGFYRFLINTLPDSIYILNAEGILVYVNDRCQELLGLCSQELIGSHFSAIIHEHDMADAVYAFSERRMEECALDNVEFRVKQVSPMKRYHDNGVINSYVHVSCNATGIYSQHESDKVKKHVGTLGIMRDITIQKNTEALLSHQAKHDFLTGLPNRSLLQSSFELVVAEVENSGKNIALFFIDFDQFKLINDAFGHKIGDKLLQLASNRMKSAKRENDLLVRLGGDEFILLIPDLCKQEDASVIAGKFLESLNKSFHLGSTEVNISASIGVAFYPEHGETLGELINNADSAMYQVKSAGKNGFGFYDKSMRNESINKINQSQELRNALEKNEFEMYYQPQIDVQSGLIVGAEALIRWNHPERGLIAAGKFMPFVEESGLIIPITDWSIDAICNDLHYFNNIGFKIPQVAINFSPIYLDRCDFVKKIKDTLSAYQIPPSQIEIEITENVSIRSPQHVIKQLNKLCQLGVKIAIDDFGVGYSSLSYLNSFPITTLKIDQSFIHEITEHNNEYTIVMAIIYMAKGLGLNLVVEGVETEYQVNFLQNVLCYTMQGYLFSKPVGRDHFLKMSTTNNVKWKSYK